MAALHLLVVAVLAAQPDVLMLRVQARACACQSASQQRVAEGFA